MGNAYKLSESAAKRVSAAVHRVEQGLGGSNAIERGTGLSRPFPARFLAELSAGVWSAEEVRLIASGAGWEQAPSQRVLDNSTRPVRIVGMPPIVGQVALVHQVGFKRKTSTDPDPETFDEFDYAFVAFPELSRVTRRITGNTDFGATLWDGSTVGTDEMWEEYSELNLATGRYEKKARKLFGACP